MIHDCVVNATIVTDFDRCYTGVIRGVYPPTPWSKFPRPLLSPPLSLEVGPLIAARGSGEHFNGNCNSQWVRAEPGRQRYLVNFRLKISPLVATIFRNLGEVH